MIEPLIIEKTEDTPGVIFNPQEGKFIISDRSWPENAIEFYQPIFTWLENYFEKPDKTMIFEFQLEYFNTASAKQIAKLLLQLEKNSDDVDITIKWHYDKDDVDMLTSGTRYAKLLDMKYEFVKH